eukprot:NODE_2000_length_1330_cov_6.534738_g1816_i0.p1 GENE.NODE_2000_length_1330_cov_6.534738_g1816_i0~~NODE_2000_length_1330_cov_6.534738_g1816_i0.p1  ORF type:complete len:384 (-),score=52.81 NODE_2000_length_1330_cov_6.534738_g1816_i0:49-1200(-)
MRSVPMAHELPILIVCLVLMAATPVSPACVLWSDFPSVHVWIRTYSGDTTWAHMCMKTLALFVHWNTTVVLDEESAADHRYGRALHRRPPYPAIRYEGLPAKADEMFSLCGLVKRKPKHCHRMHSFGYNRQQYSTFFADQHVPATAEVIALMDSDALFQTVPTPADVFTADGKIIVHMRWLDRFYSASLAAVGGRPPADFMSDDFPLFFFRDTFRKMRQHVTRHMGVSSFDEAFMKFSRDPEGYSQFSIIATYAYYHERSRYHFVLQPDRQPRMVGVAGVTQGPAICLAFHAKYISRKSKFWRWVQSGFCTTQSPPVRAGHVVDECQGLSVGNYSGSRFLVSGHQYISLAELRATIAAHLRRVEDLCVWQRTPKASVAELGLW